MANDGQPPTAARRGGRSRNTPTRPDNVATTTDTMWKAAQLRAAGATFREIGETLGIDHTWARTLVLRALDATKYEAADLMRTQEGQRLDRLQRAYWPQALNGNLRAAALCLRISERRARLFGLDAPVQAEVEVVVGTQQVDEQMAELEARLAG